MIWKAIKDYSLVVIILLGLAYWGLKDELFILKTVDGNVVSMFKESVYNASRGHYEQVPILEIETAKGRERIEVPLSTYNEAHLGLRLTKKLFTNRYIISR